MKETEVSNSQAAGRARELIDFLVLPLPSSLLAIHPNSFPFDNPHPDWDNWTSWAKHSARRWENIAKTSKTIAEGSFDNAKSSVTSDIQALLADVQRLSLPRTHALTTLIHSERLDEPIAYFSYHSLGEKDAQGCIIEAKGMSPKKAHEVFRMTRYISKLLETARKSGGEIEHIVDVGAGQGYLSRELCNLKLESPSSQSRHVSVLALDSSSEQTNGAERRSNHLKKRLTQKAELDQELQTLTHRTFRLARRNNFNTDTECKDEFNKTIQDWIHNSCSASTVKSPAPVALVALHACGSLTPEVFRRALAQKHCVNSKCCAPDNWVPLATVVVGCCYNLLDPLDFPLSQSVSRYIAEKHPDFVLTPNHLQLAAQVPTLWMSSEESTKAAALSIKKVVYRALLAPHLKPNDGRLGKLNDKVYEDFQTFLSAAGKKMNVANLDFKAEEDQSRFRQIEVLHTLRCHLGPAIESLIVLDRFLWLSESVAGSSGTVQLINMFDQKTGSGRNLGLVLEFPA